jgi:WD40 repeat protein
LVIVSLVQAYGQELATLNFGDSEAVWNVAISPNGESLVAVTRLGNLTVWDIASKEEQLSIKAHDREIPSVCFATDGKTIFTAGYDKKISQWDLGTGKAIISLKLDSSPYDIAVSPDGAILASSHQDGLIRLWHSTTGKFIRNLRGHDGYVGSVAFSPDGTQLASSGYDQTIRLWDVARGTQLKMIKGDLPGAVLFGPPGNSLLAGNINGVIRIWDLRPGMAKHELKAHSDNILGLAVSADGKWLASAAADNLVKVWDLRLRKEVQTLRGHTRKVHAVAFSPDAKLLVSGGYDGTIRLWSISTTPAPP